MCCSPLLRPPCKPPHAVTRPLLFHNPAAMQHSSLRPPVPSLSGPLAVRCPPCCHLFTLSLPAATLRHLISQARSPIVHVVLPCCHAAAFLMAPKLAPAPRSLPVHLEKLLKSNHYPTSPRHPAHVRPRLAPSASSRCAPCTFLLPSSSRYLCIFSLHRALPHYPTSTRHPAHVAFSMAP